MRRLVLVASLLLAVAAGGCDSARHVAVVVMPRSSVEDQRIDFRVSGLAPHQHISLRLHATDAEGHRFSVADSYVADANGTLDTARTASQEGGTYAGAWSSGLLVTMHSPKSAFIWHDSRGFRFRLDVRTGGRTVATSTFVRRLSRAPLRERHLAVPANGFEGTYAFPRGAHDRPAVLDFGGSEGGPGNPFYSASFAAEGIPALTVGYFHAPGLPRDLKRIPIEYFARALRWLDRQPQVDSKRVTVIGVSRGSEAALLLAVHFPSLVGAVAAIVPSSVANCGIQVRGVGGCVGPPWTLHGRPLPYTREFGNLHPDDDPHAAIPVGRIHRPILLACAGMDDLWPSCPSSHEIERRHGTSGLELDEYPQAGHYIGALIPYEPSLLTYDIPTERAREALWPRILAFVKGVGR